MAEPRLPYSWVGTWVEVETSPGHALGCTLQEITTEGIAVSYSRYVDDGTEEAAVSFYPWTSIYRVTKAPA
jgi:hypothetical protein